MTAEYLSENRNASQTLQIDNSEVLGGKTVNLEFNNQWKYLSKTKVSVSYTEANWLLVRLGQREATVEIKVKRKGGIRFFPQPFFLLMFFNYTYSEVPSKSAQSFFLSLAISSHNSSNTSSSSLLCPFISRANSNLTLVVNSGFINFSMSLLDLLATLKVSL